MPQRIVPMTGLTVREQVAYHAWLKGVPRTRAWELSARALERVQVSDLAGRKSGKLSGGELRRLGLAQSIVHQPPVLLLDEPTAGLDPAQRGRFREILRGLTDGTTVLVSTHQTSDLSDLFHRVIVLSDGQCRFTGDTEDFLVHGGTGTSLEHRAETAYTQVLKAAP